MSTMILLSLVLMTLALCLAFVRLYLGPSLPDRVVALELFSSIIVGIIGVVAIATDVPSLLDVAIVMALMAFMAAIGFARFLERGGPRDD
ncbi:monovalent cation/H+ antiporter complex subunit F [Halomonas sp. LR3S48]|uniref:monovalent cation/H+ antiporter complex subunit F n=1 Tax=Halomonadaceae TaxID=28256 RepID=UPI0021E41983|nr:monovalent cation/H+ antiporter complex subunit F [Halomonas sp. LR3S48]UYG04812.1 monovalent cation/H+ antiporter complex subunit F [Halomonas sp. LR3S48]